ncbi:MAG: SCO family protein [Rhodomicrobium sp.]
MKPSRAALFALVFFVAGFAGVYAILKNQERNVSEGRPLIGGAFSLVDGAGNRVTDRDFRGRLMLVFFGYTHCPDVCPTELQNMADVLDKLGPDAGKVAPIFVSVDPKRDTPAALSSYVSNFSPRIVGLTGDRNEVADAAKAYRVYFRKAGDEAGDSYTVDHSAFVYLMDREGRYLTHFSFNTEPKVMVDAIRKQIAAGRGAA